jgi:hypothetical protein
MNIGILLLYGFILFKVLKKEQKMEMIVLTGVAFYILNTQEGFTDNEVDESLVVQPGGSVKPDPVNIASNQVQGDGGKVKQPSLAAQMNMGPYDGICLKTGNQEYWMKSPDNTELVPNDALYSYLGSQGPIKMRLSDQAALTGPPVDGVKGSAEKKFMFANNKSSLACCPSTFSTSTGCVCTTENQRDFIAARGVLGENPGKDIKYNEF